MRYYVHKDEETWGPFERPELHEMLEEARVAPSDLGVMEGSEDWRPLGELLGLSPQPPLPPPSAGPRLVIPSTQGVPSLSSHAVREAEAHQFEQAGTDHCSAYAAVFFVAGFNLLFGIIHQVTAHEFVRMLGSGPLMLLFGIVFTILGVFVVFKSKTALAIALVLFLIDTALLVYGFLQAGSFPIASLIVRVGVIAWMASGFSAIDRIRSREALPAREAVPQLKKLREISPPSQRRFAICVEHSVKP